MRLLTRLKRGFLSSECLNIQLQTMLRDVKLATYSLLFITKLFCTDGFTELCRHLAEDQLHNLFPLTSIPEAK